MKITILGSGTSTGVPEIGCKCLVCTSSDPRDNRLRCSGLIETEGLRILIDCGPDFREQMIRCNLQIFLCLFLEKLNMPQNTPVTKAS